MFNVEFRRNYTDETPVVASFDEPQAALAHAATCLDGPYYMLRIHDTETAEWLTYAQLDFRINGGLVPR